MKVLLTGGAGFIGSNLIHHLIAKTDYHIFNLDKLTYAGNLDSLTDIEENSRYDFERIDVCDIAKVKEVFTRFKPDAVIHLAAESHVDRSIGGPDKFIQTNILGTFNLLQTSLAYWQELPEEEGGEIKEGRARTQSAALTDQPLKQSFRFLHVSTDEVYGSLSCDAPAFTETTPYDPHSPYSASKASSDHLVRAWSHTYGLPVLITNCSNNYGPYQFPEKLIPVVILKCLQLEPIPIYGNGQNVRDWLHVFDHCAALHTVLEKGKPGRTYNIGGNNEKTNIDLVRLICNILDELMPLRDSSCIESYQDLITFVPDRPGHDQRYAIDTSRVESELAWQPSESGETGFRKTVEWYLQNREWWQNILNRG